MMSSALNRLLVRFQKVDLTENVFRMHVTHSDLDGIGCVTVRKAALPSDVPEQYQVHTYYVDRPSAVNDNIMSWVDEHVQCGHIKPGMEVQILITDLSGVDLMLFNQIEFKYSILGLTVIGIVIDHHVHTKEDLLIANFINACVSSVGWPKFNVAVDYSNLNDTPAVPMSSTLQLASHLDYSIYEKNPDVYDMVIHFANAVSQYDTGNWGNWECETYDDVDDSVRLQLCFNEYSAIYKALNDPSIVIPGMVEDLFSDCILRHHTMPYDMLYVDPTSNDVGVGTTNPENIGKKFGSIEFANLSVMQAKFLDNLQNVIGGMQIPGDQEYPRLLSKYPILANIGKVYFIRTTDDRLSYFSLISRKYFEDHPNVHALILWDRLRHEAGFRSDGKIDVSEIARAFDGGGHVKASGYPLHASSIVTL